MKVKKCFRSKEKIEGSLSYLANGRDAIFYQDKGRTQSLIDTFRYQFEEITFEELQKNVENGYIYVIQTASNRYIEIEERNDLNKFTF